MNRIPVLPTLLTLGNGVCGFAAIAFASKITLGDTPADEANRYWFLLSALLIFVAMIFDVLDGYAARLSRTTSEFGGQLDSLCDAISFGAAPAFLLLRLGQEWQGQPIVAKSIAVIAAVYLACAVLRLARYNIESTPENSSASSGGKKFKGLPSPAAAGCVASLAVLRSDYGSAWSGIDPTLIQQFVWIWAPIGTLCAALLMVSQFPYPHFGRQLLRGKRQFRFFVQAVVVLAIVALTPTLSFFLLFWAYALMSPVRSLVLGAHRRFASGQLSEQTPRLD